MIDSTLRPAPEGSNGAEPLFVSDVSHPMCFAMRNLHLLVPSVYREANDVALRCGGLNRHGLPVYRVVWGWEEPHVYIAWAREFFYLQRWIPAERISTEEDWLLNQKKALWEEPGFIPEPYPRQGEYVTVRKCQWARSVNGRKVGFFRWPDRPWVEGAIIHNKADMDRTPGQIREDVAAHLIAEKRRERQLFRQVEDQHDIRNIRETMTERLIRNPSLRKDPSFILSPATSGPKLPSTME
jgi:hypothetical protein